MKIQNNHDNQNQEIIPQSTEEMELLNDSEEIDLENLEELSGAGWLCDRKVRKIKIVEKN
jgi:hypothetical protein